MTPTGRPPPDVVYIAGAKTAAGEAIPDGWYRRIDPVDPKQMLGPLSLIEALYGNVADTDH